MRLALPIILGELAQISLGITDSAMVGAVSYQQLAAAALVSSFINIPYVFGIGITISVSQMVSMALGRNDKKAVSHYLFNGFWLCVISAIIIALFLELGSGILLHLNQDPVVAQIAIPYLKIIGWSVIPMLMFLALKQFTDGLEFTKTAMVLSLAAIPLNIFLNWLLIYGNWGFPRMELLGAGWGTLITRSIMFLILAAVILYHKTFRRYMAVRSIEWKLKWKTQKELLHIGIPSSLQISLEAGAFALSGILIGTLGAVDQAAHQIALSCASFTFMVSMGFSQAASIRTSNAFGRKDYISISNIGKSAILIALIYGLVCGLVFIVFKNSLPLLFNDDFEVVKMAAYLLLFAAIFQISDSTQAVSAGLLRGVKDVKIPTYFIALSYWVVGLPVGYVLGFNFKMGAAGMWTGFIVGLTLSSIFLSFRFRKIAIKRALG